MRKTLLVPFAALTLAGCGGGAPAGNGSATSSTTQTTTTTSATTPTANTTATTATTATTTTSTGIPTAASLGIKPGKWENRVEILEMDMPGAPPQMQAAIRQGMASHQPEAVTSCLSADEAAKGPANAFLDKAHCSFTKADTGGGHISTAMTCDMPNGKLTSQGEGIYTPTSYTVEGHGSMTGRMSMTMHTRTTGKWLGECDGTEANAKGKK